MSRGNAAPYLTKTAGLRTSHLTALLVVAHAPLMMMWAVVPTAFSAGGVVATPLVFLLGGLIVLGYVLAYSGLARRIRHSGGLYVVVTQGLGRKAGLGTATLVFVCYLVVAAGVYGLLGRIIQGLMASAFSVQMNTKVALFIGIGIVLAVTRLPLKAFVWAATIIAIEQFVAVLWFDLSAVRSPAGGHVTYTSLDPGWLLSGSFAVVLVFGITAFIGSEVGTAYSTEMADPARSVPKATYWSYVVTTVVLVLSAWAVSVTVGAEDTPSVAVKMDATLMPGLVTKLAGGGTLAVNLLLANLIVGIIATAVTLNNAAARQLAGLARDGVLPAKLAPHQFGAPPPVPATLIQLPIATVFAFVGSFTVTAVVPQWIITGAGLGIIGSLTLAAAATAVWFLRGEADEGGFFGWEGQVIAGMVAVVATGGVVLYGIIRLRDVVPGAPAGAGWIIGLLLVLVFGAGVAAAYILRSTNPAVYAAIGKGLPGRGPDDAPPSRPAARVPRPRDPELDSREPAFELPAQPYQPVAAAYPQPQSVPGDYQAAPAHYQPVQGSYQSAPGAYPPPPAYQQPPPAGAFDPLGDRAEETPAGPYHRPGQTRHRQR